MSETWFRGEVDGVRPAKPLGHDHELGDGMYLADKPEVATHFAQLRTSSPDQVKKQRVSAVTFDRSSLGRVLDLTRDHRWTKFMRETVGRKGPTNEDLAKRTRKNHYVYLLKFLQDHKLNREDFDAIIAWNYVQGGRLMCIVSKKGMPSRVERRLRRRFKPVQFRRQRELALKKLLAARGTTHTKGRIPFRASRVAKKSLVKVSAGDGGPDGGPSGGGGAIAVGLAGAIVVDLLLVVLEPWLREKFVDRPAMKQGLKEIEPKIESLIQDRILDAANLRYGGDKAYANITIEISWRVVEGPEPTGENVRARPEVSKDVDVNITAEEKTSEKYIVPEMTLRDTLVRNVVESRISTSSLEIDVPDASIEFYASIREELAWYRLRLDELNLHHGPTYMSMDTDFEKDVDHLVTEMEHLVDVLAEHFGVDRKIAEAHLRFVGLMGSR
jgi:hypothetical protein